MLWILLLSCAGPASLGGQSGSELDPDDSGGIESEDASCEFTVTDAGVESLTGDPPAGFENTLSDLAAAFDGTWSGALMLDGGEESLAVTALVDRGSAQAFTPADPSLCGAYYQVSAALTFVSDAALDEEITALVELNDSGSADLFPRIAAGELVGAIAIEGDTLLLYATANAAGTMYGDVSWESGGQGLDPVGSFEVSR
jgi:hypothetical protein